MYRISLIGFGHIGKIHIQALRELKKDCNFLGFYDIKNYRTNTNRYNSLIELLADKPDIVVICTPSYTHVSLAKKCAMKGIKNIVIEKPISFNIKEINELDRVMKTNKVNFFPVNQLRMKENFQKLYKLIINKKLGKPFFVNINSFLNRNKKYFKNSEWKGIKKYDGGVLYNQFYHQIDLICWLFGKPDIIRTKMIAAKNKIKDTGSAFFYYSKKKIIINFNYTICVYDKNLEQSMTVFFKNGTVKLSENYNNFEVINNKLKKFVNNKQNNNFKLFYKDVFKKIKKKSTNYYSENIRQIINNTKIIKKLYSQ